MCPQVRVLGKNKYNSDWKEGNREAARGSPNPRHGLILLPAEKILHTPNKAQ